MTKPRVLCFDDYIVEALWRISGVIESIFRAASNFNIVFYIHSTLTDFNLNYTDSHYTITNIRQRHKSFRVFLCLNYMNYSTELTVLY